MAQAATVHAAREIIGAVGARRGKDVSQDVIFKRDSGVHVTSLAEVHTNYFAKLKPGQLLTAKGLGETSAAMRRWWQDGRAMHAALRGDAADEDLSNPDNFQVAAA